ncbi:MAG: SDR family oxidoreductase [Acidimicrobiia bacterium]|nr:SDR family oxidoreductase [Acidimicrobiia bacterium]
MALPTPAPHRTAVITGASSGIGAAIARELAGRGHGVTLVARRAERLAALAEELTTRGARAEVLAADLSDRASRAELLDRVRSLDLMPAILVNNAGISTTGPVAASDPEAEMAMIELDVLAVADLCSRFVPVMVEAGVGAVLNVASTAAFQPLPGQAGYAASKAFVLSYTRSLAGELRGTGVTTTALCPGPVETEFAETAGFGSDETGVLPSFMWESPEAVARCGVDGLDRGDQVAIPGLANRVSANVSHLVPKRFLVPLLARTHPALRRAGSPG